jgi:hypothetical protein
MICHVCRQQASGQCKSCGRFYCPDHGDVLCVKCRSAPDAAQSAGAAGETANLPASPAGETPPGAACRVCSAPSVGACKKCGKFYCAKHGAETMGGPFCTTCYDESVRPRSVVAGIVLILGALFLMFVLVPRMASQEAPSGLIAMFVGIALLLVGVAVFNFWHASQTFPGEHAPEVRPPEEGPPRENGGP